MMNTYIFTFGCGQQNAGHYQIVKASDVAKARELMFKRWGPEWCWMYTAEQWLTWAKKARRIGMFVEVPLKEVLEE